MAKESMKARERKRAKTVAKYSEKRRKLKEAGDFLVGQLPEHPNHPKGRNPYAHVAICIKDRFSASYKDIPDERFNEVLEYIEFLKKNPS